MPEHHFGLISDTHGHLYPRVFELFEGVEAIYHAGDVCGEDILTELEAIAPTHAVHGNCDFPSPRLPAERVESAPFGTIAITHGHLVQEGTTQPERLARHFQHADPRIVLFGHSHVAYKRMFGDTWVINPGAAGKPRFRIVPSVMRLVWNSDNDTFAFHQTTLDWSQPRSF